MAFEIRVMRLPRISESENRRAIKVKTGLALTNGIARRSLDAYEPRKSQPIRARYILLSYFIIPKYILAGNIAFKILEPSRGGTGIRLKIARPMFMTAKIYRKSDTVCARFNVKPGSN